MNKEVKYFLEKEEKTFGEEIDLLAEKYFFEEEDIDLLLEEFSPEEQA